MSAWAKPLKITPDLPKVKVEVLGTLNHSLKMNNLPATITINGAVWTRTAQASQNGTYSYGSQGGTSQDIATNPHYTVSPTSATSTTIYNVHYTVPGVAHYYYYPAEPRDKRYLPEPIPDAMFRLLKFMVDKLLFTWSWHYLPESAFGPATKSQVS